MKKSAPGMIQKRLKNARGTSLVRALPKIGRNKACPCGSGIKYKNCCIARYWEEQLQRFKKHKPS